MQSCSHFQWGQLKHSKSPRFSLQISVRTYPTSNRNISELFDWNRLHGFLSNGSLFAPLSFLENNEMKLNYSVKINKMSVSESMSSSFSHSNFSWYVWIWSWALSLSVSMFTYFMYLIFRNIHEKWRKLRENLKNIHNVASCHKPPPQPTWRVKTILSQAKNAWLQRKYWARG